MGCHVLGETDRGARFLRVEIVEWKWNEDNPFRKSNAPPSGLRFVFVDGVSFRQHAFMQDAGHENAARLTSEEHDVLALFHTA